MNRRLTISGGGILLFLAIFMISFLAGCKTQEIEGHWISESIQIDGQRTEWNNIPATYFEDYDIAIGLCNDSDNFYFFFSFRNPMWAHAIRTTGLTLWLDGGGKKKKDLGIRYIGRPSLEELRKNSGFDMPDKFAERLKERDDRREENPNQITILDKKNDREEILAAAAPEGPAVGFASSKDIYTYEFRLPLAESGLGQYGFGANPGETVCIGAEWGEGEFDMGERQRPGGMGGGIPGGGGRGMPGGGGGRGGGGFGRHGGTRPQFPEKQEIWIKTRLAIPPEDSISKTGYISPE